MTVIASASGIRIDCDNCGAHVSAPEGTAAHLRTATGYVNPAGQSFDFCPGCAEELFKVDPTAQ